MQSALPPIFHLRGDQNGARSINCFYPPAVPHIRKTHLYSISDNKLYQSHHLPIIATALDFMLNAVWLIISRWTRPLLHCCYTAVYLLMAQCLVFSFNAMSFLMYWLLCQSVPQLVRCGSECERSWVLKPQTEECKAWRAPPKPLQQKSTSSVIRRQREDEAAA